MGKYAVLKIKGKQYKVAEGMELLVDKLNDTKVEAEVLLFSDGKNVKVGKPKVSDVKVVFKVLKDEEKGEKIEIYKYKSKSRYRKHTGFRPKYSRILVEKISA
jgi:large subunit ribosomal protein L21